MALRLRQERYTSHAASADLPYAQVLVDSGVFHLDNLFDYKVPQELHERLDVGSKVLVSFNGRDCEGVVYSRSQTPTTAGRTFWIKELLSPGALIHASTIELVNQVSKRWCAHPYDIWRSILPVRVKSQEGMAPQPVAPSYPRVKKEIVYRLLQPHRSWQEQIVEKVRSSINKGSVLIVLPEEKEVAALLEALQGFTVVDISTALSRGERYRAFLSLRAATKVVVVGARSAIFAPIADLVSIIVHREISENHYEIRRPGWNTRDVALLRRDIESSELTFTGYGPSMEMARLIDSGYISFSAPRNRLSVRGYQTPAYELLPSGIISQVRRALQRGNVLFLSPRKGYSSGVICQRCRSPLHHSCGAILTARSLTSELICSGCHHVVERARCSWCSGEVFSIMGRGSERIAEEIGRAFPGRAIYESTGEKYIPEVSRSGAIVIATPGAQPRSTYSGIFLLDVYRTLAGIDQRALERAHESYFFSVAMSQPKAEIGICVDPGHPLIAELSRWNPNLTLIRELRERNALHLPPFRRQARITIDMSEIELFVRGVKKAQGDGRLPQELSLHRKENEVLLYFPHVHAEKIITFLREYQRRRSLSQKKLLDISIDPYT